MINIKNKELRKRLIRMIHSSTKTEKFINAQELFDYANYILKFEGTSVSLDMCEKSLLKYNKF